MMGLIGGISLRQARGLFGFVWSNTESKNSEGERHMLLVFFFFDIDNLYYKDKIINLNLS